MSMISSQGTAVNAVRFRVVCSWMMDVSSRVVVYVCELSWFILVIKGDNYCSFWVGIGV